MTEPKVDRFLRLPEVAHLVGFGKSLIYAKIRTGDFPPPIRLGHRTAAWRESEVRAWMERRVAEARGTSDVA